MRSRPIVIIPALRAKRSAGPRRLADPHARASRSRSHPSQLCRTHPRRRASPACGSASRCAGRSARAATRWSAQTVGESAGAANTSGSALDDGGLLLHLGMSGSLAFATTPATPGPHDHFDLVTARGTLRLTDPRRFGAVVWSPALDAGAGRQAAGRPRHRAVRRALRRRPPARRAAAPARRREEGAARRRHRRRRRQHLRVRGALRSAASIRARAATASAGRAPRGWPTPSARPSRARSSSAARPCATFATPTARPASSSSRPRSTAAPASPACAAAAPCGASSRASARPSSARAASGADAVRETSAAAGVQQVPGRGTCDECFVTACSRSPCATMTRPRALDDALFRDQSRRPRRLARRARRARSTRWRVSSPSTISRTATRPSSSPRCATGSATKSSSSPSSPSSRAASPS